VARPADVMLAIPSRWTPTVVKPELPDAHDRDLLSRIGRGDEEAFRGLFRRYAPTAMALAERVLRRLHLAEETVQEAFLALWRNPEGYDPERGSVRAWLLSTVHHRAVDLVRREEAQRRRAVEAVPEQEEPDHAVDVVEEIGAQEERVSVREALQQLPPDQREVIELMYYGGRSQSRIAQELDLPLGTVKSRTLLGMRRLRAALSGLER
jgi:RNA polymerase sigma factor (sigma-70 family)